MSKKAKTDQAAPETTEEIFRGAEVFTYNGKVDFSKTVITKGVNLVSAKGPIRSVANLDRSTRFPF